MQTVGYHPDVMDPRLHRWRRKVRGDWGDAALTITTTGLSQADDDSGKKARLETPAPKTKVTVEEALTCTRADKSVQASIVGDKKQPPPRDRGDAAVPVCRWSYRDRVRVPEC